MKEVTTVIIRCLGRILCLLIVTRALALCGWAQPEEVPPRPPVRAGKDWHGNPFIVVGDAKGRAVRIFIGELEANAIAMFLEGGQPPRPMTHDLMLNMLTELGWEVSEVRITKLAEHTFHAGIVLTKGKERKEIDSRTSDAIALALRAKAPILVDEGVVQAAMAKDYKGNPLPLDDAVKLLQKGPDDVALDAITWAIGNRFTVLELTPKEPSGEVWGRAGDLGGSYGQLKGDVLLSTLGRLKELAKLKPEQTGAPQSGTFDFNYADASFRLTVTVTPRPQGETVRVEIAPLAK